MKVYLLIGIACITCLSTEFAHAALPAPTIASSSSSPRELPALTALQQEKLAEFKKKYKSLGNPTTQSVLDLIQQYNIHPDYIRYGSNDKDDKDCALGWAIQFSKELPLARYLLEHGANPNMLHNRKHIFTLAASVQAAQLLLEFKADIKLCAKDLLPAIICNIIGRDLRLIPFYINNGVDPDLIGRELNQYPMISLCRNEHPMISLCRKDYFNNPQKLVAQYLIEGGTSLSYKRKDEEDCAYTGYTAPQILKKKLIDDYESLEEHKVNDQTGYYDRQYTDTLSFIAHVKKCVDDRRAHISSHLNAHMINDLANMVMDYYEPTYEAMESEPFPPDQADTNTPSEEE